MLRNLIPLFFICLFTGLLQAQTGATHPLVIHPDRYVSPVDANLQNESAEVDYYASQLALLKEAYAANIAGNIVVHESAVLNAIRNEINQLELKVSTEAAQTERRKSAGNGQIAKAATADEAPARDPLADATTPDEIRLETMQYTLAAFERHSFDPAKPEDAARDFAKLDKIQTIMQEALAELKAIRR